MNKLWARAGNFPVCC